MTNATAAIIAYAVIGAYPHLWVMNHAFVRDRPKNPDAWLLTQGVLGLMMFPFWPALVAVAYYEKRRDR